MRHLRLVELEQPCTAPDASAAERAALARILIWARAEAESMGCEGAAAHLRAALLCIHGKSDAQS